MKQALLLAHKNGLDNSILSAADQETLDIQVDKYELRPYFKNIFGLKNKAGGSKKERGFDLLKKLESVPKEQILYVGDTLHDLEVANALGVESVLVTHGHNCPDVIKKSHNQVLEI